jgi:tetratricopeptide (TPR) repeat protein
MYKHYFGNQTPLMQDLNIYLGLSYSFPLKGNLTGFPTQLSPTLLKIESVNTDGIFPVFYQYYDENPIGSITLKNGEKKDISDIRISVFVKRYMDSPKVYSLPEGLDKNETREVELFALFNENVLEITEGTKSAAEISIEYTIGNEKRSIEHIETLKLENRNASIWDDDRRAAAFVTAKDPAILKFAKNTASILRNSKNQSFDYNLRMALAIHQSLNLRGLTYVVDPNTPFIEFNESKNAIDYLQFPKQTLEYKAGDCDDLSILYAALLESVSVDTAFITVPGHIYIAVALDMGVSTAEDLFSNFDDLIIIDEKVWLPIEVTQVQKDFRTAWQTGAREWKEFSGSGMANLYPIKDAWKIFEPVGLPGSADDIEVPEELLVQNAYMNELAAFTLREIASKEKDLISRIEESGNNIRLINKLGVLYAKFGLLDKAAEQFEKILKQREFAPALLNLGNINYLKDEPIKALSYYQRADILMPDNSSILLGIARVNHNLENYDLANQQLENLKILDHETAA